MEHSALTEAIYYILLSLDKPLHGYGIMQNTEKLSQGRLKLAAGTLYGALNNLMDKGRIEVLPGEANSRKKEYQITSLGRKVVRAEIARLKELYLNGEALMEEWEDEDR